MALSDPHLLVAKSLYCLFPLSVGWTYCVHKKQVRTEDGRSGDISLLRFSYKEIVASILRSLSHSTLGLSFWEKPAAMLRGGPVKRPLWINLEVDLLRPATIQVREHRSRSSLSPALRSVQAWLTPWQQPHERTLRHSHPAKLLLDFWPTVTEINVCCFQLLSFGKFITQ